MNTERPGFSLLEVLISLFIMSILIGLTSSSFLNISPKYTLQRSVWEITSRLNYARYKAVFKGQKVRVRFDGKFYWIEKFEEDQAKWIEIFQNLFEGVDVEANNNPIFHPGGTVSNLASIYVSNSWGKYKITIAITGRIKTILI